VVAAKQALVLAVDILCGKFNAVPQNFRAVEILDAYLRQLWSSETVGFVSAAKDPLDEVITGTVQNQLDNEFIESSNEEPLNPSYT